MKLTIESTEEIATVNGTVPARVWTGTTPGGAACHVLVVAIGVPASETLSEFEASELVRLTPETITGPRDLSPSTN